MIIETITVMMVMTKTKKVNNSESGYVEKKQNGQ